MRINTNLSGNQSLTNPRLAQYSAMSGFIGPPLPPGLLPPVEYSGAEEPQAVSSEISPVSNNATAGPVLPPGYGSGPANKYQQEEVSFGPALPPSLPLDSPEEEEEEEMGNLEGRRVIGPALPIQMQLNQAKGKPHPQYCIVCAQWNL